MTIRSVTAVFLVILQMRFLRSSPLPPGFVKSQHSSQPQAAPAPGQACAAWRGSR